VVGVAKNHNLAKHIADAMFEEIFRELGYKAEWYGRTYLPLDGSFPSSKLCSSCGRLLDESPLSIREWDRPACGGRHDCYSPSNVRRPVATGRRNMSTA
jgi:putative transposase